MIELKDGGRINLQKTEPGLTRVRVGLGWKPNAFDGQAFDLDASAFLCKDVAGDPKLASGQHFVFYNNLKSPDGAVVHLGDCRTGDKDGDDETITVDLSKIAAGITEISFVVTIHEAEARKQNFGKVNGSYIKLYNDETGAELAVFNLGEDFSDQTSMQFGSLYMLDGQWRFKAVAAGYKNGLEQFFKVYGSGL